MRLSLINRCHVGILLFAVGPSCLFAQSPVPNLAAASHPQSMRDQAEEVVRDTLNGMNSYGWDVSRKGILINWRRADPSQVQCHPGKCEPVAATLRHDSLNDVRTLQSLYWYKARHPQDHSFDAAIARLAPSVHDRYDHTELAKGYLYPVLLRLAEFADTPADRSNWVSAMQGWAAAQVKHIDPAAGVQHRAQGNCDCGDKTIFLDDAYRVGAEVENGAALIHAGSVFNKPEWVAAGYREVHVAYDQAYSKEFHVFGRIYIFSDKKYGKNLLWDAQATPNDVSEEADLLLRAGLVVKDREIQKFLLNLVGEMLTALRTLPFHDKVHGGYVSAVFVADQYDGHKKGEVRASGREARQLSLLGTLALANRSLKPLNQWADLEAEMLRMTLHTVDDTQPGMRFPDTVKSPAPVVNGYPASNGGYMYQVTTDFTMVSHPEGTEDWISAEADNLALIGLQEWLSDSSHEPALPALPATAATTVPLNGGFQGLFAFAGEPKPTDPELPYLAGANLIYYWTQLEPEKGKIDFDRLDRDIAPWAAQQKVVCLRFSTAGWTKWYKIYTQQATPQWVYDEGVPSVTEEDGARIPVYWNPVYQQELQIFIAALAKHLDGNPAVAYIQIAIGDGGETLADTYTPNKDRLALWKPAGYTDALWWQTVQQIAATYKNNFKKTPLALMIDSTFLDKTPNLNFHTVSSWAAAQGFWLQDNGLTSKRVYDATWASAVRVAEPREAAAKNGSTFREDLQRAIDLKVKYFLIFRQDIYDPANLADLQWAAAQAGKL